jgi:hypothetical protein
VVVVAAYTSACGRDEDVDIREPSAEATDAKLATMDEDVLKAMAEPKEPGRIIYDAPPDLSYASAQLRRPDLVRPDTSKKPAQSDTTKPRP